MKYTCKKQNEEICTVTSPKVHNIGDLIDPESPVGVGDVEKVKVIEILNLDKNKNLTEIINFVKNHKIIMEYSYPITNTYLNSKKVSAPAPKLIQDNILNCIKIDFGTIPFQINELLPVYNLHDLSEKSILKIERHEDYISIKTSNRHIVKIFLDL